MTKSLIEISPESELCWSRLTVARTPGLRAKQAVIGLILKTKQGFDTYLFHGGDSLS